MADLSITPRPEDGPQLWYSDGKFVQRMDCDDIDNNFNPSDRDLKFMRSVLELALTQVAEWGTRPTVRRIRIGNALHPTVPSAGVPGTVRGGFPVTPNDAAPEAAESLGTQQDWTMVDYVRRLDIRPHEVLVFRFNDDKMDAEAFHRMVNSFEGRLPEDVSILFINSHIDVFVIGKAELPDRLRDGAS
jgi:hypothetical protein